MRAPILDTFLPPPFADSRVFRIRKTWDLCVADNAEVLPHSNRIVFFRAEKACDSSATVLAPRGPDLTRAAPIPLGWRGHAQQQWRGWSATAEPRDGEGKGA